MSPRLSATSSTQAFGTRVVTSGTWYSATGRPGRRSESHSGRARLIESGATRRHDRFVLASSRQPVGPCNRLRATTSSSLTSGTSSPTTRPYCREILRGRCRLRYVEIVRRIYESGRIDRDPKELL